MRSEGIKEIRELQKQITHEKSCIPKKTKLTVGILKKELKKTHGIMAHAAKNLGVTRVAVFRYIERHPELKEELMQQRETIVDLAETKLIDKLEEGSDWAIKYTLSTLGKKRGFVERTENANVNINLEPEWTEEEREKKLKEMFGE
jgi:hypothetical protein